MAPADAGQRARLRETARQIADATGINDYMCWKCLTCAALLERGPLTPAAYR